MSDHMQYFIQENGVEKGPFSLGQMRMMWASCQVNMGTKYRTEGMDTWCPLGDVVSLMEEPRRVNREMMMGMIAPAKSRAVYIVLGIFLGCLGIHNFYGRRYVTGFAQLMITLVLGWAVVGIIVTGLWALLEIFTVTKDGTGVKMD